MENVAEVGVLNPGDPGLYWYVFGVYGRSISPDSLGPLSAITSGGGRLLASGPDVYEAIDPTLDADNEWR